MFWVTFFYSIGNQKGVTPMPFDEPKGVSMTYIYIYIYIYIYSKRRINGLTIGSLKVQLMNW